MSGIFGFTGHGCDVDNDTNRIMTWNSLYGRAENEVIKESVILGCCHEKISDHAKKEKPVIKRGNRIYVSDVILFNRDELLDKVQGKEALCSDEELLAEYIEKFGIEELAVVNGDFAGVVYDAEKKEITLFRDHMGVRPLFYYEKEKVLAFSTDIRGLLGLDFVDTAVSEEWISRLVKGYGITSPTDTEYENIHCVKPGSYRVYNLYGAEHKVNLTKEVIYWTPGSRKVRCKNEKEYQKKLYELVTDAVKRRVEITSKRVGAELSGGLDSSVIDIIINRLGREGLYHSWSKDPHILSLVEKDERIAIEDICRQEGIECHFTDGINAGDECVVAKSMNDAGLLITDDENMEFRFVFPPYINTEFILDGASYMKENGVDVVFSGHAGDEGVSHRPDIYELFYHHEYYHYLRNMWRRSWRSKNRVGATIKMVKKNIFHTSRKYKASYEDVWGFPKLLKEDFALKYTNERRYPSYFFYNPREYIKNGGSRNRLDNLALQGACCGVRYFIPYADYRLIDFAVSIPRYNYIHGDVNRYIFREAFKDIMPKSLYSLNVKAENSRSAEKRADDWFEKYKKSKKEIVSHLNKSKWGKYLSYDKINEWLEAPEPTEETEMDDTRITYLLTQCAKAQNALDVARGM